MKEITTVLTFTFFFISHVFSQNYVNIIEYKTKQGDTTNFDITNKKTFNDKGFLVEEVQYNNNTILKYIYIDTILKAVEKRISGKLIETEKLSYNNNKKLIKSEIVKEGLVISKDIFVYDTSGFLIEETNYIEDSTANKTNYVNNNNGNPTIETEWELNKIGVWEKTCSSKSKWNENGKIVEWENSDCNPVRNHLETWSWDDGGRLIKHQTFTSVRKLYREDIYTYQDKGYQIVSTGFNYDGSVKHLNTKSWEYQPQYYTYCKTDKAGRLTEEKVIDEKEKLFSLRIFRYDINGNLLQEIYCNSNGTLNYSIKYEYK